jgi:hypothetical protein
LYCVCIHWNSVQSSTLDIKKSLKNVTFKTFLSHPGLHHTIKHLLARSRPWRPHSSRGRQLSRSLVAAFCGRMLRSRLRRSLPKRISIVEQPRRNHQKLMRWMRMMTQFAHQSYLPLLRILRSQTHSSDGDPSPSTHCHLWLRMRTPPSLPPTIKLS